jgi:hypothetical protein
MQDLGNDPAAEYTDNEVRYVTSLPYRYLSGHHKTVDYALIGKRGKKFN